MQEHMISPENVQYKSVVEKIKNLNWENLPPEDLQKLMYLSYASAREFAESLRIARDLYPDNENLKDMAEGELQTSNLSFEDYNQAGDHADFLEFFLKKHNLLEVTPEIKTATEEYVNVCQSLDPKVRAMTIFSREEELSEIFERILQAKDWTAPGLPPFQYYLKQHIALDAGDGGHADLVKEFPVDDQVKSFYEARLQMYQEAIPDLV